MAPKGVPKEVVETIVTASKKAIEQHRSFMEDRLKQLGPEIAFLGPEEMDKENRAISKAIEAIFKDMKAK